MLALDLIPELSLFAAGTNFPPELYDGHLFGKESYYTELAKVQMVEMDRREKVRTEYRSSMVTAVCTGLGGEEEAWR